MSNGKAKEAFQLRQKNEFCRLNTSTGHGPMVPEPWVKMRPEKGCSLQQLQLFLFLLYSCVFKVVKIAFNSPSLSMLSLFFS
jgi:hypothetical protein